MPLQEEVFYPQIVNPNILRAESAEVPWRTKSQRESSSTYDGPQRYADFSRRILGFTSAEEKMFNLQYTTTLISKVA